MTGPRHGSGRSGVRGFTGPRSHPLPLGIVILHEDRDILVINKPPGLLTVGTDRQHERTAFFFLMDYVRKGNPRSRNRVFIVHRLDRETSGLLVFARTEEVKRRLQEGWDSVEKRYLAVVHGHMEKQADTVTSYLAENAALRVYSTPDKSKGKLSQTAYRVMKETRKFSLLEINLLTGRKNQIRVQMAGIGHPVVGDQKYGQVQDPHKHLALHAWSLSFPHPFTGALCAFWADVPPHFTQLLGPLQLSPPASPVPPPGS